MSGILAALLSLASYLHPFTRMLDDAVPIEEVWLAFTGQSADTRGSVVAELPTPAPAPTPWCKNYCFDEISEFGNFVKTVINEIRGSEIYSKLERYQN
jgi:hypothetical protein